jgi:hypothetical protein
VLTGPQVIVILKIAVSAVTVVLGASLVAIARGQRRLHGRLNFVFFGLTATALLGLELLVRVLDPSLFDYINSNEPLRQALQTHLCFALPAALLMPLMLTTGLLRWRRVHLTLAVVFSVLWIGTLATGLFLLPPTPW